MTNEQLGPSLAMDICPIAHRAMIKRSVVACMGGWCRSRLSCQAYHAGDEDTWVDRIAERLCPRGTEVVGGPQLMPQEAAQRATGSDK